jgi:hypothetical protein
VSENPTLSAGVHGRARHVVCVEKLLRGAVHTREVALKKFVLVCVDFSPRGRACRNQGKKISPTLERVEPIYFYLCDFAIFRYSH